MVLRCAWGTCNSDERYPERMQGYRFIPFTKPKRDLEKCKRWIKACGRPHDQLNIHRINKHKAVCSKHFVGGNGPTVEYPDPIQADESVCKPSRKRIQKGSPFKKSGKRQKLDFTSSDQEADLPFQCDSIENQETGISTQTEEKWVSPMDLLGLTAEVHDLKGTVYSKSAKINELEDTITKLMVENQKLSEQLSDNLRAKLSVDSIQKTSLWSMKREGQTLKNCQMKIAYF